VTKQQETSSRTISKLNSVEFELSDIEKNDLWIQHNKILRDLESPTNIYTRHTSDLIISLRDTSERLILSGAIPEASNRKDTASYVWRKLQENNIPYSQQGFYKLFNSEQKRDWQSSNINNVKVNHKHDFLDIGIVKDIGQVARCGASCIPRCSALLIDGKLFEQQELEEKELTLKREHVKSNFEEENEDFIVAYEGVINRLKAMVGVWRITDSTLTVPEKKKLSAELFYMKKAGEFLDMAYDRKNLISPYMQHLLSAAYAESTQKHAGGVYLMNRIDLAQRRHGEAVKNFKKAGEFAKMLSSKQTTKAMKGKIRMLNDRYEPQNKNEAMDDGFSGQQCITCKYFRVGYDNVTNLSWKDGDPIYEKYDTKLICFHCGVTQVRKHVKLPNQVPLVVMEYSKVT